MACSSGCPTQDHESYGDCLRAKHLQVADIEAHKSNQKLNRTLDDYRTAREAGLQPDGVYAGQVRDAWRKSDETGEAYRADR